MNTNHLKSLVALPIAMAAVAAGTAAAPAVASARTPTAVHAAALAALPAASSGCNDGDDLYGMCITVYNNTNQAWTFDPAASHSGASSDSHWIDRPQQTLEPQQSEVISTESSSIHGLDTEVVYQMANGEYASFEPIDTLTQNGAEYAGVDAQPEPYQYNEQHGSAPWPIDYSWIPTAMVTPGYHVGAYFSIQSGE